MSTRRAFLGRAFAACSALLARRACRPRATANGALEQQKQMNSMPGMAGMASDVAVNANSVPGFPQDADMEGPMMAMDQRVDKPENFGLRPGWSGYMMGMMTFLRVLPADQYTEVVARMKQAQRPNDPYASLLQKNS